MGILVILLLFSRATSLNFNSTTYHCNASVHECLVMDGIDSEFLMDSETSRMLAGQRRTRSLAQKAVEIRKRPAIECGRGKSYPSCEPQINPHKKDCTGIYCRTTNQFINCLLQPKPIFLEINYINGLDMGVINYLIKWINEKYIQSIIFCPNPLKHTCLPNLLSSTTVP